jgi:hypothetical protein
MGLVQAFTLDQLRWGLLKQSLYAQIIRGLAQPFTLIQLRRGLPQPFSLASAREGALTQSFTPDPAQMWELDQPFILEQLR